MENLTDKIFNYMVSVITDLVFGFGNTTPIHTRMVSMALKQMGVYENLEVFLKGKE